MIGDRIHQARKSAGLSMRALGEKAGISAMAISKYESNKSTPSSNVMLSLARALGVRIDYFFRTSQVELKEVEYRKHSRLPKKVLSQIEGDVVEQIERYLELEEFLPATPIEPFSLPAGLPEQIGSYDEIEAVSGRIRQAWQLGNNPISDLIDTLEERGIKVFLSNALHGDKFDGLAARVGGTPIIVVGRDWPGDRQRFTLVHELGHLALAGRLAEHLDDELAARARKKTATREKAARITAAAHKEQDKSIESWIWDAACSIRGAKDAPKYKDFILPLISTKRLCDVFNDEVNRIAAEVGSRQGPFALFRRPARRQGAGIQPVLRRGRGRFAWGFPSSPHRHLRQPGIRRVPAQPWQVLRPRGDA